MTYLVKKQGTDKYDKEFEDFEDAKSYVDWQVSEFNDVSDDARVGCLYARTGTEEDMVGHYSETWTVEEATDDEP